MTQYIRFTKTNKQDVTVGKLYEVKDVPFDGYYFDDDAGDERYVCRSGKLNSFEVLTEQQASDQRKIDAFLEACDGLEDEPDGVVCIDFIDGYVAHFHDVDVFNIEERVGIALVVITDVEGGKTLIPFDRVRKIRLLHLHNDIGN